MDAKRISKSAINEGILQGKYHLTGILNTGEVVLTLLSDLEREMLDKVSDLPKEEVEEKIFSFKRIINSDSEELYKVYEQLTNKNEKIVCKKNKLIIRD